MNLAFKTHLNGVKTHFMEKIMSCDLFLQMEVDEISRRTLLDPRFDTKVFQKTKQKRHTIRVDEKNRWKVGNKIHFIIANRTKNRLQFAPVVPVVSIQKIEIITASTGKSKHIEIKIDGEHFGDAQLKNCQLIYFSESFLTIANNDGFETVNEFLEYFNEDFTGKLIHWTNLNY